MSETPLDKKDLAQEKAKRKAKLKSDRAEFKNRWRLLLQTNESLTDDYTSLFVQEDGRAHIVVDLRDLTEKEIYEPFSASSELNSNLLDYIRQEARYLRITTPLTIDFLLEEENKSLEKRIKELYTGNYHFDFSESRQHFKRNNWMAAILLGVGMVFLSLYAILATLYTSPYNEIISIVAWVFVWEAVDRLAFTKQDINLQSMRDVQLCTAEVNFTYLPLGKKRNRFERHVTKLEKD